MATSTFSFTAMAATVEEEKGLSFQDKALTWDTPEDGKFN